MILLIDNYDSFTWNVYQLLAELGAEVSVVRNDELDIDAIRELAPAGIVISPGPGTPSEAGISREVIRQLGPTIPLLGVCLGMQCIGEVFGGVIIRADELVHGKTSDVLHTGTGLFAGVPSPFEAVRYHSLVVRRDSVPDELEVTAVTSNGLVMGLHHRHHPIAGVQFHPESILTQHGALLLGNFLETTRIALEASA